MRYLSSASLQRIRQREMVCGLRSQQGMTLPLTIILLTAGVLLAVPLLTYLSSLFAGYHNEREQMLMRLAAEGAINRVVADLQRGADGLPTTYVVVQPHAPMQSYLTFTVSTTYTPPSLSLNDYTPIVTITAPTVSTPPLESQQYADPGFANPDFAVIPNGYAYLIRLYRVVSGTLQVNWAYSPQGVSRIGIWDGFPVDNRTGQPFPPGRTDGWPTDHPILDTGFSPGNVSYNRTSPVSVGPGVYTIVFDNSRGNVAKTTAPYAPSGGPNDTWIYVNAHRDYLVTATAGDVTVSAYLRQIPGYSQPPTGTWSITNPAWISNSVYIYSWKPPN